MQEFQEPAPVPGNLGIEGLLQDLSYIHAAAAADIPVQVLPTILQEAPRPEPSWEDGPMGPGRQKPSSGGPNLDFPYLGKRNK